MTAFKHTESAKLVINKKMCVWTNTTVKAKFRSENLDKLLEKDFYLAQYEPSSMQTMDTHISAVFFSEFFDVLVF